MVSVNWRMKSTAFMPKTPITKATKVLPKCQIALFPMKKLRLFLALADTGSVSAAARATHVTQPTASMQLRELSDAVGMPLYEVISRRVHLTEVGRDLAETVRRISGEWEDFGQRIDALKGLTRGRLSIAVVSTAKYFLPRVLGTFCGRYPGIDASLVVLNRDGVVERLQRNQGGEGFQHWSLS